MMQIYSNLKKTHQILHRKGETIVFQLHVFYYMLKEQNKTYGTSLLKTTSECSFLNQDS